MAADWGETSIARLRFAWEAGFTAREIAEQFGDGRTRNSIIGMAHRLNLTPRETGARRGKPRKRETGQILSEKGYRKAYRSKGDLPRARFVRVDQGGEHGRARQARQPRLPGTKAAFIQEGRTKFAKSVVPPSKNILVSGHNNIKIGKTVMKGRLRGYDIFVLSLEERKTCPSSCQHWQTCYGNNMPFAKRVDHTHPEFLVELRKAIGRLVTRNRAPGILIRLHALGDFYSPEYVNFWRDILLKNPTVSLYGYTAYGPVSPIGRAVQKLNHEFGQWRSMIRFSNGGLPAMSTVSIGDPESRPADAFVCPEQLGKSLGCDYCGACWGTTKNVAFLEH